MNFRFTFISLVLFCLLFSSTSSPQQLKDKNKIISLTAGILHSLAHYNNEPSGVLSALKSTIVENYSVSQIGPDKLTDRTYSTYEDSLIIKYCDVYYDNPLHNYYTTYLYDNEKKLIKEIQRDIDNSIPGDIIIYSFSYNSVGKVSQVVVTDNDTPWIRESYYYDSNNYFIGFLMEMWTGSVWQYYSKDTDTCNSFGNPISVVRESWSNGAWVDIQRYTYAYNGNLLFTRLYEHMNSNVWVVTSKDVYSYNTDNTISYHENDSWNGSSWIKSSYGNYSYPTGKFLRLTTYPTNCNYLPGSNIPVQWVGLGINSVNIKISTDNGNNWNLSASNVPDTGNYTSYLSTPLTEYPNCKIRVEDAADPNLYDQNIGSFSLIYAYDTLTQNTGKVKMTVFNNGIIGSDGLIGQGFHFMDYPNALYSGGMFFGNISTGAYGMMPSFRITDLGMSNLMRAFTSNAYFNTISTAYYSDSIAGSPYNVFIKEQTFGKNNNPYIIYLYNLQNRSSNTLSSFYIGTFADWDIGNYGSNLGGYSVSRNMAYQFDSSGLNPNYYGIVALSGMSGANVTDNLFNPTRSNIIQSITALSTIPITASGDYRTLIGSGPYNIPSGHTTEVGFAFVSGTNLADLESNADLAIADWNSGIMGIEDKNLNLPLNFSLGQNYPNPFNPATTIEYTLPKETSFKIELFNSLGQKVKDLYKGVQNAGTHKLYLDGSGLSTGVYFYRFTSEQFNATKKLILLK